MKSKEREESERFWADVKRTAQEVATWPEWKRGITGRFLQQQEEAERRPESEPAPKDPETKFT